MNQLTLISDFLDHLIRQWPSESHTVQKRSFFARGPQRSPLDNVIEAMKGVYSSIRLCNSISEGPALRGLAINVDVANGTFWSSQDVMQACRNLCVIRNKMLAWDQLQKLLLPQMNQKTGRLEKSADFLMMERMKKLKFTVKHHGKTNGMLLFSIANDYY